MPPGPFGDYIGPVWVADRVGCQVGHEVVPCDGCAAEELPPDPDCDGCSEHPGLAVVCLDGLLDRDGRSAPCTMVPYHELWVATQDELEAAWLPMPGAWPEDEEALAAAGLHPPARWTPRPIPDAPGPLAYFLRAGHDGLVKIGHTRGSLRERVRRLQTGSSEELLALAYAPGPRRVERELHERFAHLREHGEWFRPEPELMSLVSALRRAWARHAAPAHAIATSALRASRSRG